jgi:hypothetical protein
LLQLPFGSASGWVRSPLNAGIDVTKDPFNFDLRAESADILTLETTTNSTLTTEIHYPYSFTANRWHQIVVTGTPFVITGVIEAEMFDRGGPGVAYSNIFSYPSSDYRVNGMFITNCDPTVSLTKEPGYCLDLLHSNEWVGSIATFARSSSAAVCGNSMLEGFLGIKCGTNVINSFVLKNDFSKAAHGGIFIDGNPNDAGTMVFARNTLGKGVSFHLRGPKEDGGHYFSEKNIFRASVSSTNSIAPFLDGEMLPVHIVP